MSETLTAPPELSQAIAATELRAPYNWFGGKRKVAEMVWERFGDVPNYVEPFYGSGAVLLGRPTPAKLETINDKDAFVVNFWRAIQNDPEAVARWANAPVNESDLMAKHRWLAESASARMEVTKLDPDFYDAKVAGFWVWGICAWIGGGWCDGKSHKGNMKLPHLGGGMGIHRREPHLPGCLELDREKGDEFERLYEYFGHLARRLRHVRVACGDWSRVMGDSVTFNNGLTGVFLDPPYDAGMHSVDYAAGCGNISKDVREWAIANGENPLLRICLCGYEGEHAMPDSWETVEWKATGGYGNLGDGRGRENAAKERIWFSPACLKKDKIVQSSLF